MRFLEPLLCNNPACTHTTFYAEYFYNACKPGVKEAIIKQSVNGSGIRAISRCLGVSTDTVISELKKKEKEISNVNTEYFESHSSSKIRVEIDEMWSFY
ncbi:MAG: hypothetical protein LBJ67_03415, partial [Planctomycetaceae bacterium]|nr:hypothetical protein [Planctomycetaceae bacterium]